MMGAQQKLADVRGAAGLGGVCAWSFDKVCWVRGVNATSHVTMGYDAVVPSGDH